MARGLRLIDDNRPEEAAVLLEELHDNDPGDDETSVALASAYAAMAKLRISAFYDLFYELIFVRPLSELQGQGGSKKYRALLGTAKSPDGDRFGEKNKLSGGESTVQQLREAWELSLKLTEVFANLPELSAEQAPLVGESIRLLEQLVAPKKAHHAYRALLRATLVKFNSRRRFAQTDTETHDEKSCQFDAEALVEKLEETDFDLNTLFNDIGLAFPREKSGLRKSSVRFHELVSALKAKLEKAGPVKFEIELKAQIPQLSDSSCRAP